LKLYKTMSERVIFDNECREYMEGWNANNRGDNFLSNPYGLAYDGELQRLWDRGFDDNQMAWDDPNVIDDPKSFTEEEIKNAFSIRDHKPLF